MKKLTLAVLWLFAIFLTAFRAYAQKAFQKIQISNAEGTPGTAEAATEVLLGVLTVKAHDKVFHTPEQDRGVLALRYETPFQVADEIELEFEGELYDRQTIFVMANSIRGNVTASQPDAMNEPLHFLHVFEPGLTTGNTPDITDGIDTFTLEYGDNVEQYETEYLYTKSWEITGEPNEPVMLTWTVGGRQVTETNFTGALVAPTAAYFPFNLSKFYIDANYAAIGTTAKTGMLRAFTVTFEPNFTELRAADGTFYFTSLNESPKTMQFELTYWRDGTNSEAEFDKFQAQSTSYIRIELLSHTEMDAGQSNPEYIWIDAAVKYTEWPEHEDEDGTLTVTVTAEAFYDVTASKMFGVSVGTTMETYA
jgi:hypothetical protein